MNSEVILTLGTSHYILPVKNYSAYNEATIISITLDDDSKIKTSPNNLVLVTDRSELINAILESNSENFYEPEKTKYGKTKMKKITLNE